MCGSIRTISRSTASFLAQSAIHARAPRRSTPRPGKVSVRYAFTQHTDPQGGGPMSHRLDNEPQLSLAMIVRNDLARLQHTLANVAHAVDEIVVCDTGEEEGAVAC